MSVIKSMISSVILNDVLSSSSGSSAVSDIPLSVFSGWLSAVDGQSYYGEQYVRSIIRNPSDGTTKAMNTGTLGANNTATTDDPTFTGTIGDIKAKFVLDGGDFINMAAADLTSASALLKAHRKDTSGFFAVFTGYISPVSGVCSLFGNGGGAAQLGFMLRKSGTHVLQLFPSNGSANLTITGPTIPVGVPIMVIVSWDATQTTNNVRFWVNSRECTVVSGNFPAGTTTSTRDFYIGSSNGGTPLGKDSHVKTFAWGTKFLTNEDVESIATFLQYHDGIDYTAETDLQKTTKTAVLFGDSISYYNQYEVDGASNLSAMSVGYFTQYNALAGQRMRLPAGYNLGVVGNTTTQMVARLTDMDGKFFDTVFFMGGTNDAVDLTPPATVLANINAIISNVVDTRKKDIVVYTTPIRTSWGSLTAEQIVTAKANIREQNAAIRLLDGTKNGRVKVVDAFTALDDGTDTFVAKTGSLSDGIHPSPYGAYLVGLATHARLHGVYGQSDANYDFTTGNLLPNVNLSGTAGSVSGTGASGSVADSYTMTLSGGTGVSPTAVASKPTSNSQQIVFDCPAGASSSATVRYRTTTTTGFAANDVVYAKSLIEVLAPTPVNMFRNSLTLTLTGTGVTGVPIVKAFRESTVLTDRIHETYVQPGLYIMQTPDMKVTGTGLTLTLDALLAGDNATGLAASGTFLLRGLGVFKRP